MYAIQGLKTLSKAGYKLTGDEKRIIELISAKNGMVNTCSGCIFSADSIKNVVKEIKEFDKEDITFPLAGDHKGNTVYWIILVAAFLFFIVYRLRKRKIVISPHV